MTTVEKKQAMHTTFRNGERWWKIQTGGERGSTLVEFALVLVPLLALLLLILNVGWVVFAQASLQEGVREGVRWGVTGQLVSGCSGLDCSIASVVQTYSFGFVQSSNVSVHYYSPSTLSDVTGQAGATAGGNIVQVSVSNISVKSMGAIWRNPTPLILGATASDVMEARSIIPPE
ncbi:MAG: pilus assembly protein [Acidobacteriaceae bacterium]|nr:pilus assembly protein [Acidobacteriaceae bacterium]